MPEAHVNGAKLYFEEKGSGPPILLIHGTGGNTRPWGRSFDDLAVSHRVIAYDRRGYSRSGGLPAETFRQHADDAAALLRHLDAAPATVLGWSGGGVVAIAAGIEHPPVVQSLILEEPALHLLRNSSAAALKMTATVQFMRRIRRNPRRATRVMELWALRYTSGGSALERFPADWQESMLDSPSTVMRELDQLIRFYPSREQIAAIACPVTYIEGGLSDPAFHRAGRYLRGILPQAEIVEIEGASHAVHFDRPEEFAAAVLMAAQPRVAAAAAL